MKLVPSDNTSAQDFIRTNTKLMAPPLVPEILLHLAEESLPIWQLTEDRLGEINVPPPYWAFAWAGGQALARHLLDNPHLVAGKTVLDLGSGSGLTAIAAMKAGAASVLAADIDLLSLAAINLNAEANDVIVSSTSDDLLASSPGAFAVVLVGDLYYERQLAGKVSTFVDAAAKNGSEILIGDPQRNYFPRARFLRAAEYSVPVTRELEDALIKKASVWLCRSEMSP